MDFPDQNAMDDKITSLATRLLQGELAHGDAQVNTFAGTMGTKFSGINTSLH